MHARRATTWLAAIAAVAALAAPAVAGDPKPTPVDSKPFRAKLLVLEDGAGGTYVVLPAGGDSRVWYGTGKSLYEQVRSGNFSASGDGWDIGIWAPRVPNLQPGSIQRKEDDGSYHRWCGSDSDTPLQPVTADRAKQILDRVALYTPIALRTAYLLARDDGGVYYYVDHLRGGAGYRVFVGKKGAMKELPLSDVATDPAGDVFSTRTGEVRFVHDASAAQHTATWVHGDARTPLSLIDADVASRLIFRDLGVYQFLGTICDDI